MMTALAKARFTILCVAVMTLTHEVLGLATLALVVHWAQIVWLHLALVVNRLPSQAILGRRR